MFSAPKFSDRLNQIFGKNLMKLGPEKKAVSIKNLASGHMSHEP